MFFFSFSGKDEDFSEKIVKFCCVLFFVKKLCKLKIFEKITLN